MELMEIHCKGISYGGMVWWKKIEEAARYLVYLYIAEKEQSTITYNEISCVEKDRQTLYHTFEGLAQIDKEYDSYRVCWRGTNLDYYLSVVAEDRSGNIIAKSDKIKCTVKTN